MHENEKFANEKCDGKIKTCTKTGAPFKFLTELPSQLNTYIDSVDNLLFDEISLTIAKEW